MENRLKELIGSNDTERECFFRFVEENKSVAPDTLRLRTRDEDCGFNKRFAIDQIECRKKTKDKLPHFLSNSRCLFPAVVSAEQSSDEGIAAFHSRLLINKSEEPEKKVADLTAGLGIDAMAISDSCEEISAIEIDPLRAEVLTYNAKLLNKENLTVVNADCIEWLSEAGHFDTIFIDPARRGENNSRKYRFADCMPNIVKNLSLLLDHCDRLLVKASSMLDLKAIIQELAGVTELWVLERNGECKEILIEIRKEGKLREINSASVNPDGSATLFSINAETSCNEEVRYLNDTLPLQGWLYEPSASIMKIAPWGAVCSKWPDLYKLSANSHIFYTENRIDNFPGREFAIANIITGKQLKNLKGRKINVLTRNYPLSPEELKKKAGIKDGGESFLIGTRIGSKEKPVLILVRR